MVNKYSSQAESAWLIITVLFGRLGERELHGATVRIVPLTDSTFVLLLVRSDLLVAAYMLCVCVHVCGCGEGKGESRDSQSCPMLRPTITQCWENHGMRKSCRHLFFFFLKPDDEACWKRPQT